ncbi:MAG: MazG nucleotide pyrophosphohydrolase [Brockia lithotrophica]|uniref:MazG nucleotide pyrophosphohydrolase n=1 Tax=Brockia lithotrophica TaxID=933949 RepID=A0A2T5G723_9BACL|nr:MAG: MazG nucleotide pyrophosphohydrolase [Brockia lithotrophica]
MSGAVREGATPKAHKTLPEIQREVDELISGYAAGYFTPLTMVARLAEEVGELAREVNHRFGEKPKKPTEPEGSLEEELGDVFFVLVSFANAQGIDLEAAYESVMAKYRTRDRDRWPRRDPVREGGDSR